MADAGDVDGDRVGDLVIGAPAPDASDQAAHVLSGRDGCVLQRLTAAGGPRQLGSAVCGAGDVNADGFADVLVGAYTDDGPNEGRAWVWPGYRSADFTCDGLTNSQDFFAFLEAFFADAPRADINSDGAVNSQDLFDFLAAFFAVCG